MSETTPTIDDMVVEDFYSPYRVSKFESQLRGVSVPPQKLYGYVRNGYIKVTTNSTGKLQISQADVKAYLQRFVK